MSLTNTQIDDVTYPMLTECDEETLQHIYDSEMYPEYRHVQEQSLRHLRNGWVVVVDLKAEGFDEWGDNFFWMTKAQYEEWRQL